MTEVNGLEKPRYKNWIPAKLVAFVLLGALALLLCARLLVERAAIAGFILMLLSFAALFLGLYLLRARTALDYAGGGVQGKVLDVVLRHLVKAGWDGHGRVLDIGCGSGALAVKLAKAHPHTLVTGLDTWGMGWEYSQKLCEDNARLEGVSARVAFRKGDAAKLPFVDGAFDAVASNFVFHEARSQPDKQALILEALRVLRPGGAFALQDTFFDRRVYGDAQAFVDALRPHVAELHFADTRKPGFAPGFLNTRMVLGSMGLIWGRK